MRFPFINIVAGILGIALFGTTVWFWPANVFISHLFWPGGDYGPLIVVGIAVLIILAFAIKSQEGPPPTP